MRVWILFWLFFFLSSGMKGQELSDLLGSVKNTFLKEQKRIVVIMELKNNKKVLDKAIYKFYQEGDKLFIQMGDVYYLKDNKQHISVDEYSNEIVVAKSKKSSSLIQSMENFGLLGSESVPLWKMAKKNDKWYLYIPSGGQSKSAIAEIYFNTDLSPNLVKLPFPEQVEDNGELVEAEIFFKFDYESKFAVPEMDDWLKMSKGKYKGKGKYKSYEILYINE